MSRSHFWALSFALVAFAGNSLLCRAALRGELIDAGSFTLIRVISAVVTLYIVLHMTQGRSKLTKPHGIAVISLSCYLVGFSYAYINIDTGIGALLLFGVAQLVMLWVAVKRGEHLGTRQKGGVLFAFAGLVWLLWPRTNDVLQLEMTAVVWMMIAGAGWAGYSLCGRESENNVADSYQNFVYATPLCVVMLLPSMHSPLIEMTGVLLAILSGSVTSALGYVVWYRLLASIAVSHAAIWQLLVPVIATIMGVLLLEERLAVEAISAMIMVLSGVLLMIYRGRQ